MKKYDFIRECAMKAGISVQEASRFLDAVTSVMTEALASGHDIQIKGFGKLEVKTRKARMGRNPHHPEETYYVPPTKAVVFKESTCLKDAVNGKRH